MSCPGQLKRPSDSLTFDLKVLSQSKMYLFEEFMFEMLNSICSILKDYPPARAIKSTAGALEYMRSPRYEERHR